MGGRAGGSSQDDGGGGPAGGFWAGLAGGVFVTRQVWVGAVCMSSWCLLFVSLLFWGVSPTTCGSATRFTGRNPRLLRRADTAFTFIASHIV